MQLFVAIVVLPGSGLFKICNPAIGHLFGISCVVLLLDVMPKYLRSYVDRSQRFPDKLYEIVDDESTLLSWSNNGRLILVDEFYFENHVMQMYPGFVAVMLTTHKFH